MIPAPITPDEPTRIAPPALVAPAPREVSFGRIAGTVSPGTRRLIVSVNGKQVATRALRKRSFSFTVSLPRKDVRVRVTAIGGSGERASAIVGPVYGLPRAGAPVGVRSYEDRALARKAQALARGYPGVAAVYVLDLRTGAGAAWNARARFPAASTLKLAIAVEALRLLPRSPPPGSRLAGLLRAMLVESDNKAANELEVAIAGSTSAGAAMVNRTMRALGLADSEMYGGYAVGTAGGKPIPLRVERQPAFGVGKHTTAYDLGRLLRLLHLAAGGRGALVHRVKGFSPSDARTILFLLARSSDHGKLDRFLRGPGGVAVLDKAGWITEARHDAGLVYSPAGAFVAAVMTWSGAGVGTSSDVLAGRIAQSALERFRRTHLATSYDERRGRDV